MKKIGALLLMVSLLLGSFSQQVFAAETTGINLTNYLNEISASRGIDVSEEDIELSLLMYDKELGDFSTNADLNAFLGDVIAKDYSNLSDIYSKYSLDKTSLEEVLNEYGEELSDYIFLKDLDSALSVYTHVFEQEADFADKLEAYLAEVSLIRGMEVNEEDIAAYLSEYSTSTADFETVADLKDYLGEVIKEDLSNLSYFNENYEIDEDALFQLIEDNGKSIEDYIYIGQLEELVWDSMDSTTPEFDPSMYMELLSQIGLTDTEIQALQNHFLTIADYISSEEGQAKLEDISTRMLTFAQGLIEKGTADENYKPNDAEISEFAALYEELLSTVQLKVSFSIIKDGIEKQYSIEEMMKMDELTDVDYKVTFYNDKNELLADAVITSDFIKTYLVDAIEDGGLVNENDSKGGKAQTVKGGRLPDTATNYIPSALFGLLLATIGLVLFCKMRTDKRETLEKQFQ